MKKIKNPAAEFHWQAAYRRGWLGGIARSAAKAEAARRNGRKGGRPRKTQAGPAAAIAKLSGPVEETKLCQRFVEESATCIWKITDGNFAMSRTTLGSSKTQANSKVEPLRLNMTTDIECQVCHRITFEFETHSVCQECHWPVRPVKLTEPVFGFDVAIKIREGSIETKVIEKHFWTDDEKTARRRAKATRNFVSVAAIRPLTERAYCSAYGDPRDKSKFA